MDWKSRLVVSYADGPAKKTLTPISSFQPSFSLSAEPLHSIESTHIGVIYAPAQITFSMSVTALGSATAELTQFALTGKRFEIVLEESDNGHDWALKQILLKDCVITSASPSSATISGAPAATFSGFALQGSTQSSAGTSKVGAIA
jgi:hypothetical protein